MQDGAALQYASVRLKRDGNLVRCMAGEKALMYASDELKKSDSFLLACIRLNPLIAECS